MYKILGNSFITNVKTKHFQVCVYKITKAQTSKFHRKSRGKMRDVVMRCFCADRIETS